MKRVLVLSDASCGITGFSNVIKHILKDIYATGQYEIVQIGINYDGSGYDNKEIPYKIIPATSGLNPKYNDLFGRQRFLDILTSGQIDLVYILNDMSVVSTFTDMMQEAYDKLPKAKKFVTMYYFPVDSHLDTKREWVVKAPSKINYPVVYTEYGLKEISKFDPDLAKRCKVCYHGIDETEFFPISPEEREKLRKTISFGKTTLQDRFVILNVNRNQIRKDYVKTFLTMAELKKKHPEALLIAFAAIQDQGGDLIEIAKQCGLEYGKDWIAPEGYTSFKGVPVNVMNQLYNIADCVFSTTHGEGFGLSSLEGMATRRPCVFPGNSMLPEIFGGDGNRGRLVLSGNTPNNFVCYGVNDSSLVRPSIDVVDAAEKLAWVIENKEEASSMAERGYTWVQDYTWSKVNRFWTNLFEKASKRVDQLRGV
jgi:glycosyltransferase involved in cell wall biosynthesis